MSGGDWEEGDGDGAHRYAARLASELEREKNAHAGTTASHVSLKAQLEQVTRERDNAFADERFAKQALAKSEAANAAMREALRLCVLRFCFAHYGEGGEDYPEATHQHLGKHGWETRKCELPAEIEGALASDAGKDWLSPEDVERVRETLRQIRDRLGTSDIATEWAHTALALLERGGK